MMDKNAIRKIDDGIDTYVPFAEALLARGPPLDRTEDTVYRAAEKLARDTVYLDFWRFDEKLGSPRELDRWVDGKFAEAVEKDPKKLLLLNVRWFYGPNVQRDVIFAYTAGFSKGAIELLADMNLRPERTWDKRIGLGGELVRDLGLNTTKSYKGYPYDGFMTVALNPKGPKLFFVPLNAAIDEDTGERVYTLQVTKPGWFGGKEERVRFQLPYRDPNVDLTISKEEEEPAPSRPDDPIRAVLDQTPAGRKVGGKFDAPGLRSLGIDRID